MAKQANTMDKFDFLLGNWNLDYRIPKSTFSEPATGAGTGTVKRALDDKYVHFDYSCVTSLSPGQEGKAHGVFAWDENAKVYRFWWFESSGHFEEATCKFVSDDILFLSWHRCLLVQTFRKETPDKVVLRMEQPDSEGKYELILEVIFTRP